jgi:hypothetical protein
MRLEYVSSLSLSFLAYLIACRAHARQRRAGRVVEQEAVEQDSGRIVGQVG